MPATEEQIDAAHVAWETEAEKIVVALEAHLFASASVSHGDAGPEVIEHTRGRLVKVIAETLRKIDVRTHVRPD